MAPGDLLAFMRSHRYGVQASVSPAGAPQAAVVGFAVTDRFELVFDTLDTSRKAVNLRAHAPIAFVIGGLRDGEERTVQFEGVAHRPTGAERERLMAAYYQVFPEGPDRLGWPGLIYVRARPTWIRFSDYGHDPPLIVEFTPDRLAAPSPGGNPA